MRSDAKFIDGVAFVAGCWFLRLLFGKKVEMETETKYLPGFEGRTKSERQKSEFQESKDDRQKEVFRCE